MTRVTRSGKSRKVKKHEGGWVRVTAAAAEAVKRGHPWVWKHAVDARGAELEAGSMTEIRGPSGESLGRGVFDPESPIALRVWARPDEPFDEALIEARVARALALRRRWFGASHFGGETTAYRLIHGEGDRMPGFVVDRYGSVGIVRVDGVAAEAWLPVVTHALEQPLGEMGITTLARRAGETRRGTSHEATTLFGPDPPERIEVREHGVPFIVDLLHGQKTGAFLDQRENRARIGELTQPGQRALNLFSYAGGFSLHAARAGATVTSVDVSAGAHATAQASFRLAGLAPNEHEFVTADAFAWLDAARRQRRRWDLVICDPPSFAPSEKAKPRAMAAYRALHRACAAVLEPGGLFCASSCSSHVTASDFLTTLDDAALGVPLSLLELFGHPVDHPTLAAWPEGRYLKFAVLARPT
jgi:23S rRNA (cytosine1962-C5)-methyltransferase